MLYAGLILVASCVVWLLGLILKNMELNSRDRMVFFFLFVSGMSVVALSAVNPPSTWDLFRHYELLDNMRQGGMKYVLNNSMYTHLPVVNFFYAIIAFTGFNQLLPFGTTLICYLILAYIISDYSKCEVISSKAMACMVVFNLAFCPFFHMVSGIRNALAFAVFALGIYEEMQHRRFAWGWLLYVLSIFIHPSAVLLLGIRILVPLFKAWRWIGFLAAAWSVLADWFAQFLKAMPIRFISDIGYKLEGYTSGEMVFTGYKILAVKLVLFISIVLLLEYIVRKAGDEIDSKKKNLIYMMELTSLVALGSFNSVFIADRLCFFLAFASIPALAVVFNRCKGRLRYAFAVECFFVCALIFVYQLIYFING